MNLNPINVTKSVQLAAAVLTVCAYTVATFEVGRVYESSQKAQLVSASNNALLLENKKANATFAENQVRNKRILCKLAEKHGVDAGEECGP